MMPRLYTFAAVALAAGLLGATGAWRVQEWRWQSNTLAAQQAADEAQAAAAREQRLQADTAAGQHAARLAGLNKQLGDARAQIAQLSGRACLDGGTVSMLNHIGAGGLGLRAPASHPAGAPAAAASDRDVATALAVCRGQYAAVSDQLSQILDIEDKRHPVHTSASD